MNERSVRRREMHENDTSSVNGTEERKNNQAKEKEEEEEKTYKMKQR